MAAEGRAAIAVTFGECPLMVALQKTSNVAVTPEYDRPDVRDRSGGGHGVILPGQGRNRYGDERNSAYRALWLGVIDVAFRDVGTPEQRDGWFTTRDFVEVCALAGVEPDDVRRAYRARVAEAQNQPLTAQESAFLFRVLIGIPKTKAALQAGYGSKAMAAHLLARPHIQDRLQKFNPHRRDAA